MLIAQLSFNSSAFVFVIPLSRPHLTPPRWPLRNAVHAATTTGFLLHEELAESLFRFEPDLFRLTNRAGEALNVRDSANSAWMIKLNGKLVGKKEES
ncbi:hypothetical protein O6P43_006699 [Quillaja saponaria]|uniref:Uncharacterized protein n=1 Tax=Quillaja saponaria TaxID=32244 RepID=A0AAD7VIC4_QUISA|nr:hypothetical protein O6P43_006699 [Quillaja saponaria]